jgi:hypothetical protein
MDKCLKCGVEVEGYEPQMCCNGYMCGCRGMPIEPCLCPECWDIEFPRKNKSAITQEERK